MAQQAGLAVEHSKDELSLQVNQQRMHYEQLDSAKAAPSAGKAAAKADGAGETEALRQRVAELQAGLAQGAAAGGLYQA